MARSILIAILGFLFFLIIHVLIFVYINPIEKVNSLMLTFGFTLILTCIFYWCGFLLNIDKWIEKYFQNSKKWIGFVLTIFLLVLLFIGYLEFYFTVDRSITFRMLIIVDHFKDYTLSSDQLLSLYNTNEIIKSRISDLEFGGYLKVDENLKLAVTEKGKIILSIYKFALDLLNFSAEEFVKDPNIAKKLY